MLVYHRLETLALDGYIVRRLYANGVCCIEDLLLLGAGVISAFPGIGKKKAGRIMSAVVDWQGCGSPAQGTMPWHVLVERELLYDGIDSRSREILASFGVVGLDSFIKEASAVARVMNRIFPFSGKLEDRQAFVSGLPFRPAGHEGFCLFGEAVLRVFMPFVQSFPERLALFGYLKDVFIDVVLRHKDIPGFNIRFDTQAYRLFMERMVLGPVLLRFILGRFGEDQTADCKSAFALAGIFPWDDKIVGDGLFLDDCKVLVSAPGVLVKQLYTLQEWVDRLPAKAKAVVVSRLGGESYRQLGEKASCSGENVRMVYRKAFARRPPLQEDSLVPLFLSRRWVKDAFCAAVGVSSAVYYYLLDSVGAKSLPGQGRLSEPEKMVSVFGCQLLPGSPLLLEKGVEVLAKKPLDVKTFYKRYMAALAKAGITGEQPDSICLGARLYRVKDLLFTGNGKFRYFPVSGVDIGKLETALGLSGLDGEYSAARLFEKHPGAMKSIGICNGNELHSLLRKYAKDLCCKVRFGRMPVLFFGEKTRREQLVGTLKEVGSARPCELARLYRERYGIEEMSFKSNYLKLLKKYRMPDGRYVYKKALEEGN